MSENFTLENLLQEIAAERAVDFRGYKRATLERRFRKRMSEVKVSEYAAYAAYLRDHPDEVNELLNTVLINITEFFRDSQAWEVLRREVLPRLLEDKQPGDAVRCWSAGCASGEEPYSIAILLAEHFGEQLPEYDVKIYATDIDEEALAAARRAEYSPDALKHVRAEWRNKYFQGENRLRVRNDLRRLCIFGRSNILTDAPISHVDLLVCRNLLIYFDTSTQGQILMRLHYALEPQGILFLGKASALVGAARLFHPINAKFRLFRRADFVAANEVDAKAVPARRRHETDSRDDEFLRLQHASLLETLAPGVLVLDSQDTVLTENSSATRLWGIEKALTGKSVLQTELAAKCPDLAFHLEQSRERNATVAFQCLAGSGSKELALSVTIKPVISPAGGRVGTLVYMEDVSPRERLQAAVKELESTGQELQSANEELETTNEELQSANEELETTNEELQSTNEELETTNEELQSLNEELQTANEELATRGKEMDELTTRYEETLERMPWPVMVVGSKLKIEFWNTAAQKLFGFNSTPAAEMRLEQLPVPQALRSRIIRRQRAALSRNMRMVLRNETLDGPRSRASLKVYFMPLARDGSPESVLIMFDVQNPTTSERAGKNDNPRASSRSREAARSGSNSPTRGKAKRRGRK